MTTPNERQSVSSDAFPWRAALPCLTVFAATFLLFGMLWPAMSPGVRASLSVDFCLPHHISSLSQAETETLETLIANQVSSQLTGPKFESLIWQTKRTGSVNSSAIEYFDHETISQNMGLAFDFHHDGGQLRIEYTCQGYPDQLRLLQLVGQQVATSIDGFFISKNNGLVTGNQLNSENFDRAIWLANQIQTDLSQIRDTRSASHNQSINNNGSPYSFASAKTIPSSQLPSERTTMSESDLDSIDANSLLSVLNEIKTQSASPSSNDITFSVLSVGPVKSRAINATPRRGALLGLIAMSCLVTGLVAMFQFAPAKSPTDIDTLSETLGIPVVAVLPADSVSKPANGEFLSTVSHSAITVSKFFLIFVAVVIVAFSLLDSSIREAFFQNPFDGLAKIFGVFFGHA